MLDTQTEPSNETSETESTGSPETEATLKSESTSQSNAIDDDQSDLQEIYYEVDGEEVSAADIKKWKSGHLMQSDYTRKTQSLAEERKKFQTDRDDLEKKLELLGSVESELNEMILGDLSKVDLNYLRETDVSEYLRVKELKENSGKKLAGLSQKVLAAQQALAEQGFKQLSETLGWSDTSKFESDKKTIQEYAKQTGITERDFQKVTSPAVMTAILEAAKYRKLQESNPTETKRVKQAPKIIKPAASKQTAPLSLAERMYGKKR
jgi:hypothetical protein